MNTFSQDILDFISENLNVSQHEILQMQMTNPIEFNKMVDKMKRKMRIEKAKQRGAKRMSKKIKKRKQLEEFKECDRKAIQMIRNRISAQNSRDRKKQYLTYLEQKAQNEIIKHRMLRQQLEELKEEKNKIINKSLRIQHQLSIIAQLGNDTRLGKIGQALLTLVSVFSAKQHNPIPVIKVEEPDNTLFDKSYSVLDTNTFIEEKIEAMEDSDNCYNQMNQLFHLQSPQEIPN